MLFSALPRGETGAGIGFRSLIYVPSELPVDFWQRANDGVGRNVRMLVKRVFITDDLGDGFLPKWLSFLRIVVDGTSCLVFSCKVVSELIWSTFLPLQPTTSRASDPGLSSFSYLS